MVQTMPVYFEPTCKVCDRGKLVRKKVFRLSGPAVVIGYIMLIPSVVGVALSAAIFFVLARYSESDYSPFIGFWIGIYLAVGSFVAGIFGWLLIMKKRVLECSSCSATINAS